MADEITIRPLLRSDRRALVFTFGRLSAQSRYQRYFSAKPTLTAREVARLMSVDHWHHEALIAFSPVPSAPIGIARYARLEEAFDAAEIAIEVVDAWQRRGVGAALMTALTDRARAAGIRRFNTSMLRDNKAARALAGRLGPPVVLSARGSLVELSYALGAPSAVAPRGAGEVANAVARMSGV